MPNRRAGESRHHAHAQVLGRTRAILHRLDGPLAFTLRIARQRFGSESVGTLIIQVAHELAREVI